MSPDVRSQRKTEWLECLFAVVVYRDGQEGVVRRDTPSGTQPWVTDDPELADQMLPVAREASGFSDAYLVRFDRSAPKGRVTR